MNKELEKYLSQNTRSSVKDSAKVPAPKPVTGQEISPEYLDMFADWYTADRKGKPGQVVASFFKEHPRISKRERNAIASFLENYVSQIQALAHRFELKNREVQRLRDDRRIVKASICEKDRKLSTMEAYNEAALELLKKHSFHKDSNFVEMQRDPDSTAPVAIIQLSDLHLNELVDLPNNQYNYSVAAKRLAKFADDCLRYCSAHGTSKAVVAFTGDLLNSDRRTDEVMAQQSNRVKASFLAKDLLQQFLRHLLTQLCDITCVNVCGNESRIDKEYGYTDFILSNNFDWSIYTELSKLFENVKRIVFLHNNPYDAVIEVAGQNILFMHGNTIQKSSDANLERKISELKGMYGDNIRYVIFGHLHSSRIGDTYARASSMVGANAYSERALQLPSRASQNVYFVFPDGNIDGVKIDLQVAENPGYEFESVLEAYHIKSKEKAERACRLKSVIHQVAA